MAYSGKNNREQPPVPGEETAGERGGVLFGFSGKKESWSLTETALIIRKKGEEPFTYPLADITDVRRETINGKEVPDVIVVAIDDKKWHLHYSEEEREDGRKAFRYLISHAGDEELRKRLLDFEEFRAGKEIRKRCNVCGAVFCYTYADYTKNEQRRKTKVAKDVVRILRSGMPGAGQAAAAPAGEEEIRDFDRCPVCRSADLSVLSDGEAGSEARRKTDYTVTGSLADELRKFKDLLDAGAITAEEYDEAKKRLLDRL